MDKQSKELLLAKIEILSSSVNDSIIQTLCNIIEDLVLVVDGDKIGFKKDK